MKLPGKLPIPKEIEDIIKKEYPKSTKEEREKVVKKLGKKLYKDWVGGKQKKAST